MGRGTECWLDSRYFSRSAPTSGRDYTEQIIFWRTNELVVEKAAPIGRIRVDTAT